ncbi:hypothetical protein HPO96_14300 [Kribbella sandramycini]|uniref:Secreted protein n=1 Tax=Kribbella sandramycini TaxID=60450 RepID=A0A7Y4KZ98_9ACTN|nr:hypothetical protein [Kribbella sandramycini]MBB6565146.1 hypothetical protein [Kribbella sandramycini]NOL41415.1 hypothetical protein [Kribbella sandramycini]
MRTKLALAVLLVATSIAPTATAAPENYGQYSLMFERSAGQYWAGQAAAGQWAWAPQNATTSDISWGDPKPWPPKSAERFVRDGDWVMLEGYSDGPGRPVTGVQRVTSEYIGDANCRKLTPIPSNGGRQHYVRWTIPATGYCLDARGTIGKVNFRHLQKWSPPQPCSNPYYSGQTCITQFEQWWDDNQHPFALQLTRTLQLARGKGPAFTNHTTFPITWTANARYYWHYPG